MRTLNNIIYNIYKWYMSSLDEVDYREEKKKGF